MDFKAILGIAVVFTMLVALVLWLLDRIFHRKSSNNKLDEDSKRFKERVLKPDFAALEAYFGCPIPNEIKDLYANKEEIMRHHFEVVISKAGKKESWPVAFYMPADLESLRDVGEEQGELFFFANDGCGDAYVIDPRKPASEVLFHDHENGELTKVGLNLSEFVAAARKEGRG